MVPAALCSHFVAPSCKLHLARFSALLIIPFLLVIQDGAQVWQKKKGDGNFYGNEKASVFVHPV